MFTLAGAHADAPVLPLLEEQAAGATMSPESGDAPAPADEAPDAQLAADAPPPVPQRGDVGSYPLDTLSRVAPRGRLRCPTDGLVTYRGTHLRFPLPVAMHRDFVPHVQRLEEVAIEVAREVYGRAPKTMLHRGAYNCRRIRGVRDTFSEHAFGNAIDLKGFDFYGARGDEPLPEGAPAHLRRSFRITVERDFRSDDPLRAYHRRFFERLTERLAADPSWFGVMLGPSFPGHHDHLHLDRAPLRYVAF